MGQHSDSQGKPRRDPQWDDREQWTEERDEKVSLKRRDRPRRRYFNDDDEQREE